MEQVKLYPCEKHGTHEVEDIKSLDINDEWDALVIAEGYKWRGICKFCQGSIVAKSKEEYNL